MSHALQITVVMTTLQQILPQVRTLIMLKNAIRNITFTRANTQLFSKQIFYSLIGLSDLVDPQLSFSNNTEQMEQINDRLPIDHNVNRPNQVSNLHQTDPTIPHELNEYQGDDIPDISTENETDPSVILKAFAEEERQIILGLPGAQYVKDLRLFARLAPYFSGRYHIEEILFFANVRRSDLHNILDLFSPIIALHEHEDTAITSFYDTSLRVSR
jgi:hypothetical protein